MDLISCRYTQKDLALAFNVYLFFVAVSIIVLNLLFKFEFFFLFFQDKVKKIFEVSHLFGLSKGWMIWVWVLQPCLGLNLKTLVVTL